MRLGLYRRPKIYIFPARKQKAVTAYLILILLAFIFIYLCTLFFLHIQPVFLIRAEAYAGNLATKAINDSVNEIFTQEQISYQDLVNVEKDSSGYVTAIQANISKINYLKSCVANKVQSSVAEVDEGTISIPMGSVIDSGIFSGLGPRISVKVAPVGVANVDFEEMFLSTGINQVKHQIYLDVSVTISLISATMERSKTVNNKVLVAETVIVGNVPKYYANSAAMHTIID
ncbi:MAG: sporulation protein YunB [Clostridia bacterium]|nr:sporulation protein YunB [Clostridia bacterium]